MAKIIISLLIGLIAGAAITFLLFVGVPRAAKTPGTPILAPDANTEAGATRISFRAETFNQVLGTIFHDMAAPSFPLSGESRPDQTGLAITIDSPGGPPCDGRIRLIAEGSGVKTGVLFENGHISAPLAFTGSYSSPFGCVQFTGWAKAALELRFDSASQNVFGQLNVETVNLDGVNPLLNAIVTPIVQSTINNRVNPIEILRGEQIGPAIKVASTGGTLKATVKDVRAEVKEDALNLYVIYAFSGSPAS